MKTNKSFVIMYVILGIFLIVFNYLVALTFSSIFDHRGLSYTVNKINSFELELFTIRNMKLFIKVFIILFILEGITGTVIAASRGNFRKGEEHGSAKLKNPHEVNSKISDKEFWKNRILSANIRLSIIGRKTLSSLNTIILGGMGAGKSFFTLIPNILQANTSFVITDPSKELVRATGSFLKEQGYDVKVLDLDDFASSFKYNFFNYIENESDIKRISDIIFNATVEKERRHSNQDPMWENMGKDYLQAMIALIYFAGTEEEKNIKQIIYLMNSDTLVADRDGNRVPNFVMSAFDDLEKRIGHNMATDSYRSATDGEVATIRGVKSTVRGRLGKFLITSVQNMMEKDELELKNIGLRKTALFLVTPSEDTSFNFIISMIYAQLFPILYRCARGQPDNKLPIPVQFFIDEMANVVMPDDFITYLTTSRKHGISYTMYFQEMQQIKKMFKDEDETLIGTCQSFVYLGGSGHQTNKYISEWIGKETISTEGFNRSYGRQGSSSKNTSQGGREVLTADEVDIKLKDDECLVYIKGEGFSKDLKNNPLSHKNFKYTSFSEGKVYDHTGKSILSAFGQKEVTNKKADYVISNIQAIDVQKMEEKYNIEVIEGE